MLSSSKHGRDASFDKLRMTNYALRCLYLVMLSLSKHRRNASFDKLRMTK
jgi:hypothetical protein